MEGVYVIPGAVYKTQAKLRLARKEVGILLVGFRAVNNIGDDILQYTDSTGSAIGGNTEPMWDRLATEINDIISKPDFDIDILVNESINIMDGQGTIKGEYQATNVNTALSTLETGLATGGQARAKGQESPFQANVDWSKVTWSKSLDQQLQKQVMDGLVGKKIKPVKGSHKGGKQKVSMKGALGARKKMKRRGVNKAPKAVIQGLAQAAAMKANGGTNNRNAVN